MKSRQATVYMYMAKLQYPDTHSQRESRENANTLES